MKEAKKISTAAKLFSISGILFIIVGIIGGDIGVFLPVGIALIIVSLSFWHRSNKLNNSEQEICSWWIQTLSKQHQILKLDQ